EARSARAVAVGQELERAYLTGLVGTVQEVLFEEPAEGGLYTGHAPNYAKIYAPGEGLHNEVRPVRVTGLYRDGLLGELTEGAGE
ncbi:MAG: tRNA (N(6)-L-threonylcarbamoyladenosine(37)-C(2))-methylthiotransferase MtaB, partial [Clostridiales bacterium]|nr:tRNA (N(6)-L-threonylcarbamoyladenosine(37)-C(2))-methylthiotransferase MtaB [Clostridiales bacterium]